MTIEELTNYRKMRVRDQRVKEWEEKFDPKTANLAMRHTIEAGYNLAPWLANLTRTSLFSLETRPLEETQTAAYNQAKRETSTFALFDIKPTSDIKTNDLIARRQMVLMQTGDGSMALVIAIHGKNPELEANAQEIVLGKLEELDAYFSTSEEIVGTRLVIIGHQWENNPVLQFLTGALCSDCGPFPSQKIRLQTDINAEALQQMNLGHSVGSSF